MGPGNLSISERCDRLDAMIAEDRVLRGAWVADDGKERACLLAALSPEVADRQTASACPADLMPGWLAEDTVRMDDKGTIAAWPAMIRRYAAVARRWHVLTKAEWAEVGKKRATARKAYDKAVAPARKAYAEAVAPARKAYDKAVAPASKACDEAVAPASKAYDEAVATASKAYDEAVATASKAYDEAVATANDALTDATLGLIEAACAAAEVAKGTV